MLAVAALVPDTVLLVPGAGGSADVVPALRAAALQAVDDVVAAGLDTVVVVAPGPVDRALGGTVRTTLGAAGVPDHLLGWSVTDVPLEGTGPATAVVPTLVALHLLTRTGRTRGVRAVEVTRARGARGLADLGRSLVADGPTGLVVVGSGSARHGPAAPLAEDPRAPAFDARVLADLTDAGVDARARVAADDPDLADELAVRGWAPWQVLVGAAGAGPIRARVLATSTALGAQHAVLVWDAR